MSSTAPDSQGQGQPDDDEDLTAASETGPTRRPLPAAADDSDDAADHDPVRMYLRGMVSITLLTREGEVALARRIEDAEHRVLKAVLARSRGGERDSRPRQPAQEGQDPGVRGHPRRRRSGSRLRRGGAHRARLQGARCRRALFRKHQKLLEAVPKRPTASAKDRVRARRSPEARRLFQALLDIRIVKARIGPILDR
jgi:hypothetical protein